MDDTVAKSKWIVDGVLQKFNSQEERVEEVELKMEEAHGRLISMEELKKELEITIVGLETRTQGALDCNEGLLLSNNSLTVELDTANRTIEDTKTELENYNQELLSLRKEVENQQVFLANSQDISRIRKEKDSLINSLRSENSTFVEKEESQKHQLLNLQSLIALQKEETQQICS